jgi:hypothetical protein
MILSILVSLFTSLSVPADSSIHSIVEAQALVSDAGITPYWMRSLQYGTVPMENPGLVLRAWNGKAYNLKKKYDWKYEVEATGWTGMQNDFWLTQAYVSGRRGKWELWAGRRKEVYGLGDTTMTGGFYAWSGNAVPMPKIQLGTRDYLNFAKGWLGIHMTYSHGWFDNQGKVINGFLHQKSLYGRLGKTNSKLSFFAGINHNTSWAGEAKIKKFDQFDYYPSDLNTYFYVITVLKDRTIIPTDSRSSYHDLGYQFGNHLGSVDIATKIQNKNYEVLIYRQSIYETGRIASLALINDGLSGISLRLKNNYLLNKIGLEYFYSANQGNYTSGLAEFFGLTDPHKLEIEDYLNHKRDSWKYYGGTLGTPIFIINKDRGIDEGNGFSYTAIKSFHFYLSGITVNNILWKIRTSFGMYAKPRNHLLPRLTNADFLTQNSVNISAEKQFSPKLKAALNLGYDNGQLLENTVGLGISLQYKIH